jgi:16S rRNA pseudouridine516 synthase
MSRHRLDQILARHGYCSRSEARGWLRAGRVSVAGETARDPSDKAPIDAVRIDGEPVELPEGIVCLLHKPAGVVCSRDAREGPNVFSLVPERWSRRNPPIAAVGRLDKDTTGLLVLTDLGELVQRWTSPRHKVPKVYEVTLDADLAPDLVPLFAGGTLQLPDDEEPCLPARLEILGPREARLELVEGRYHQVKRMFASRGLNVVRLHRCRVGDFALDGIAPGEWRLEDVRHHVKSGAGD